MSTRLFHYIYYKIDDTLEIMMSSYKIKYNVIKENYTYYKSEVFNDSTGSGVFFTHVNLPDLSKLSEEELFQTLVCWEHNFSLDNLMKIQQQINSDFITQIENIMRVQKIYPNYRGVFQIVEG